MLNIIFSFMKKKKLQTKIQYITTPLILFIFLSICILSKINCNYELNSLPAKIGKSFFPDFNNYIKENTDILFISTKDGYLHAIGKDSKELWKVYLDRELISWNISPRKIQDNLFLYPMNEQLYIYKNGEFIPLTLFIKDLVKRQYTNVNDFLLLGKTQTAVFIIDVETGTIIKKSDDDDNLITKKRYITQSAKRKMITVLRIDYILSCLGNGDDQKQWSVSSSDIIIQRGNEESHNEQLFKPLDAIKDMLVNSTDDINIDDIRTVHSYFHGDIPPIKIFDRTLSEKYKYFDMKKRKELNGDSKYLSNDINGIDIYDNHNIYIDDENRRDTINEMNEFCEWKFWNEKIKNKCTFVLFSLYAIDYIKKNIFFISIIVVLLLQILYYRISQRIKDKINNINNNSKDETSHDEDKTKKLNEIKSDNKINFNDIYKCFNDNNKNDEQNININTIKKRKSTIHSDEQKDYNINNLSPNDSIYLTKKKNKSIYKKSSRKSVKSNTTIIKREEDYKENNKNTKESSSSNKVENEDKKNIKTINGHNSNSNNDSNKENKIEKKENNKEDDNYGKKEQSKEIKGGIWDDESDNSDSEHEEKDSKTDKSNGNNKEEEEKESKDSKNDENKNESLKITNNNSITKEKGKGIWDNDEEDEDEDIGNKNDDEDNKNKDEDNDNKNIDKEDNVEENNINYNKINESENENQKFSKIKSNEVNEEKKLTRLDEDFEDLEKVGQGGFGIVLKAKHKIDEGTYAIKIIKLSDMQNREDVVKEAKNIVNIYSKHIVQYKICWFQKTLGSAQKFLTIEDSSSSMTSKSNALSKSLTENLSKNYSNNFKAMKKIITNNNDDESIIKEENDEDENYNSINNNDSINNDSKNFKKSVKNCKNSKNFKKNRVAKKKNRNFYEEDEENNNSNNSYKLRKKKNAMNQNVSNYYVEYNDDSRLLSKSIISIKYDSERNVENNSEYFFILMEYCDGLTLDQFIIEHRGKGIDRKLIYTFTYQIMKCLKKLHSNGIIHRDIKPANIFISNNQIKIGDFGLATKLSNNSRFLQTKDLTGWTPLYDAPEQKLSKVYNEKIDIYACGITLYEMCSCFETAMERMESIKNLRNKNILNENTRINYPEESKLIELMTLRDYNQRPSAEEILTSTLFKKLGTIVNFSKD